MNYEKRGEMMYECPIIITMMRDFTENQMIDRDNAITLKIQEKIGIDVDKEELIKALNYDRQQYEKGYADAKAEYKQEWISSVERLPQKTGLYLVSMGDLVTLGSFDGHIFRSQSMKLRFFPDAWMPLPKPYEESEE